MPRVPSAALMIPVSMLVLSFAATAQEPEPVFQVTEFLEPLRRHDGALAAAAARIESLRAAAEPSSETEAEKRGEDFRAAGEAFVKEGREFAKTFDAFLHGDTRRGLDLEVDLVRDGVSRAHEALACYRELVDAPFVAVDDAARASLMTNLDGVIEEELRARIVARLEAEGLRDIVDARSWEEARRLTLARLKRRVKTGVEDEAERVFGMRFNDRRSFQRALRRRVDREVERQVARLIVRLTSSQLVIEVAGSIIVGWVKDQLWNHVWPRIRESFRQKGRHESRLARSVATMRAARAGLMELPRDARMQDVEARIRDCCATVAAARYLRRDLERSEKAEMLAELEVEITWLQKGVSFTRKRFLMHKEALVHRLKVDREILEEILAEFEKLLREVEVPVWAEGKTFYLRPFQKFTEEGIVPTGFQAGASAAAYLLGSSTSLAYVDEVEAEKFREKLRKREHADAELPVFELSRRNPAIRRDYREPHLVRMVVDGQVRYGYRTEGRRKWVGGGGFFALAPGLHEAAITVVTGDGFRFDETVTFVTRAWPAAHEKSVETGRRTVANHRKELEEAATPERLVAVMKNLYFALGALGENLGAYGRARPDELVALVRERVETAVLLHELGDGGERKDEILVSRLSDDVYRCRRIGNVAAYAVARQACAIADAVAVAERKFDVHNMSRLTESLAHLAISSSNDVSAAREYLEAWMQWHLVSRPNTDVERERVSFPRQIAY